MPRKILTDDVVKAKCPEFQRLGEENVFFNDVRITPKSAGIKPTPLRPPPMPSRIEYLSASAGLPLPVLQNAVSTRENNAIAQPVVNDLRVVEIAQPLSRLPSEAGEITRYVLDLAENRQTEDIIDLAVEGEPGLEEKSEEQVKNDPRFVELDAEGRVIDSYEGPRVEMATAFIQRQREKALQTQAQLRTKVDDEHVHERVSQKERKMPPMPPLKEVTGREASKLARLATFGGKIKKSGEEGTVPKVTLAQEREMEREEGRKMRREETKGLRGSFARELR